MKEKHLVMGFSIEDGAPVDAVGADGTRPPVGGFAGGRSADAAAARFLRPTQRRPRTVGRQSRLLSGAQRSRRVSNVLSTEM